MGKDIVELIEKYIEGSKLSREEVSWLDEDRTTGAFSKGMFRIASMEGNKIKYVKRWNQFSDMSKIANSDLVEKDADAMAFYKEATAKKFADKLNAISKRKGKDKLYVEKDGRLF